ncbi:hypothetical protein V1478_003165, partial [Vespula squamosa]
MKVKKQKKKKKITRKRKVRVTPKKKMWKRKYDEERRYIANRISLMALSRTLGFTTFAVSYSFQEECSFYRGDLPLEIRSYQRPYVYFGLSLSLSFLLGIFPINTRGKVRAARSYVNIGDGVWGLEPIPFAKQCSCKHGWLAICVSMFRRRPSRREERGREEKRRSRNRSKSKRRRRRKKSFADIVLENITFALRRWSSAGCLGLLNEPTRQRKQKCAASEALAMTSR